ncbi:MAG: ATP-dependent metallopeptidase FtsH/Yme1/Tma family protein, partial [Terriglobales bacterium]
MNSTAKTIVFWLVIAVSAVVLYEVVTASHAGPKDAEINFSKFLSDVNDGQVKEVSVTGMEVRGKLHDNSAFHTTQPANYPEIYNALQAKGVIMT